MKLTNKSIANSVSDARYQAAVRELKTIHGKEYEEVHNGSGRSEELPSDLERRQAKERSNLRTNRDQLSVMQWMRNYGSAVA